MLSGIAGLKCKLVKTASQLTVSLFIGAQELCILACVLCTIGREKYHLAFVEVVAGHVVYNFGY
jgi:hypothetical protein